MKNSLLILALVVSVACAVSPETSKVTNLSKEGKTKLSFFITSSGPGDGGNLGGLVGADAHCQLLAESAGAGGGTWRAYLSASPTGDQPAINARDRIGAGPWHNAEGTLVARDVADLHSENNKLSKKNSLTEKGEVVKGRGDTPNEHDILTGTQENGAAFIDNEDHTCQNWTGNDDGSAQVGHHDRIGGGPKPTSWNSSHGSRGCSQANLQGTGGNGYFYCFAAD